MYSISNRHLKVILSACLLTFLFLDLFTKIQIIVFDILNTDYLNELRFKIKKIIYCYIFYHLFFYRFFLNLILGTVHFI